VAFYLVYVTGNYLATGHPVDAYMSNDSALVPVFNICPLQRWTSWLRSTRRFSGIAIMGSAKANRTGIAGKPVRRSFLWTSYRMMVRMGAGIVGLSQRETFVFEINEKVLRNSYHG